MKLTPPEPHYYRQPGQGDVHCAVFLSGDGNTPLSAHERCEMVAKEVGWREAEPITFEAYSAVFAAQSDGDLKSPRATFSIIIVPPLDIPVRS